MKDINEQGEYIISSSKDKLLPSIADAIKVKVHRPDAVQAQYTLDELRDLESKLVLITVEDEKKNEGNKRFLTVSTCNNLQNYFYILNAH